MNSSRSTSNFADRPPSHSISNIARLTFFSSNSTANLHSSKALAPSLNQPATSKRNSLLTGVYNLATNAQLRIKDKYLSVNTSYFPQQENEDKSVMRKKSSGLLNISFPSIQGDTPSALQESNYISKAPRDSPSQKHPTRIYSEDYSSISQQSLPAVERKQSFDHFTKRHYSQLSPVNIYSGGVKDLQDFTGRPVKQVDTKLQEKSLRELLKLQQRAAHIEIREEKDQQESLSIQEDDDQNIVPLSYKKHLNELKNSRFKQQEQLDRPESRQGGKKERKQRGNKFRITGAGFHEKGTKKRSSLDRDSKSRFILQANLPKSLRKYERKEASPPKRNKPIDSPRANEDLYGFMMNTVDECDEDPRSALQTED